MEIAHDKLNRFLATSAVLHGLLFLVVVFVPKLFPKQTVVNWGTSTNKGIRVGSTNSLPGIPLPSPAKVEDNAKGNDSDTLNPVEVTAPKAVDKAQPVADVKIPTGTKKPDPKTTAPTNVARGKPSAEPAAPTNAIPGEATGQVALPYGAAAGVGNAVTFGDGSFGTRFPEYVRSMITRIQSQWQKPGGVPPGSKVYVTFTIARAGQVSDINIDQASGSVAMDTSAKRAVLLASPLPSLPAAYSGSDIAVRFYFEYSR